MKLIRLFLASVLAIFCILAVAQNTSAINAGDLEKIKVIGHHFTTSFNNGKRIASVKDPSFARYIVIKLSFDSPTNDVKLFTNDFVLQYYRQNGKEDRSKCSGICRANTAMLSEDVGCSMGNAGWVLIEKVNQYLSLVFFIENEVNSIDIGRIGGTAVSYKIGSDRPYSVFLTTNQGPEKLVKYEKLILSGGYQVTRTSTNLNAEQKGITINFAKQAETQAREISQRIMTELKTVPTVQKMDLVSDNDIVVWVGK